MAPPPQAVIHETWLNSSRLLPARFIRPVIQFTRIEAAGGAVLLVAALIALVWANSPFSDSYFHLFDSQIVINGWIVHINQTFKHLINDGLMAIFFFVVGLEIKRELVVGELNSLKRASLPIMAAIGGMTVPALIFATFVLTGEPGAISGWGIPMATDIAFSVGVVALLGTRVPIGAKLFLLALAIVDDVGAILVIAVFYTASLDFVALAVAGAGLAAIYTARRVGIGNIFIYVLIGIVVWYGFLESGIHATIAGVIIGLMTPVRARYTDDEFRDKAEQVLNRWDTNRTSPYAAERIDRDALELAQVATASVSPLDRLEQTLHPWSSFVIVPLFALANAGVRFVGGDGLFQSVSTPVGLGVAVGLILGKPIGITAATWIGVKLNMGTLPRRTTMRTIAGLGIVAGIGFTVSLFITDLAFRESLFADEAKLGIFLGSAVSGAVGYTVLRLLKSPDEEYAVEADRLAATGEVV